MPERSSSLTGVEYSTDLISGLSMNTPGWHLRPAGTVVLVHDMQRYFLRKFAPSADPLETLVRNVSDLIGAARRGGVPVIYTAQRGGATATLRGPLQDFWGPGMTGCDDDAQILPEIAPLHPSEVVDKWRYSAFLGNDLDLRLRQLRCNSLVICGVYAHVGILATALEAFSRGLEVHIASDATADFSRHHHRATLKYLSSTCSAVSTTEFLVKALS